MQKNQWWACHKFVERAEFTLRDQQMNGIHFLLIANMLVVLFRSKTEQLSISLGRVAHRIVGLSIRKKAYSTIAILSLNVNSI